MTGSLVIDSGFCDAIEHAAPDDLSLPISSLCLLGCVYLLQAGKEKHHKVHSCLWILGFSVLQHNKGDSVHSSLVMFHLFLFLICSIVLISHGSCILCMTLVAWV